jgi:hypothetical protein
MWCLYLPPVAHGDYFTGPLGTGKKAGFPITATQTIYFYDKSAVGPCYVEGNFLITINPSPAIDARPIEVLKCDANFVLDDLNGEYYEFAGGPSSTNPVLEPGLVITTSKIICICCCCN